MTFDIVTLNETELDEATKIWADGWTEAHRAIVPEALAKLRTIEDFKARLVEHMAHTRVAKDANGTLGLCITTPPELYQLYVAPRARGTGAAQALVKDAEDIMIKSGAKNGWLACAVGNEQAKRFYEKAGWVNSGVRSVDLDTSEGPFPLDVWYFERDLG